MNLITGLNEHNLKVSIETSARLHMGFYDLSSKSGVMYGGLGLSINAPCTQIQLSKHHKREIIDKAQANLVVKVDKLINVWNADFGIDNQNKQSDEHENIQVIINQAISPHVGLGSGTQLALAIGMGLNQLFNKNLSLAQIAESASRGKRSGIGIGAFSQGGFLVDAGKLANEQIPIQTIPEIQFRLDFPADWRILLIYDTSHTGIHGSRERQAFRQLPAIKHSLKTMVFSEMLSALRCQDLQAFGACMQTLQAYNGDFFTPFQGGRFASKNVANVLIWLQQNGVNCIGQSSWGPTGFAIVENELQAQDLHDQLKLAFANELNISFEIARANNSGASLTVS